MSIFDPPSPRLALWWYAPLAVAELLVALVTPGWWRWMYVAFGVCCAFLAVSGWGRRRAYVTVTHSISASRQGDTWLVECSCGYRGVAEGDPDDYEAVARSAAQHAVEAGT